MNEQAEHPPFQLPSKGEFTNNASNYGFQGNATAPVTFYNCDPHIPLLDPSVLEQAQAKLAAMPLDIIPEVFPPPSHSRILFAYNPLFKGRQHELIELARLLKDNCVVSITGVGGIGKTQLASEFLHRYGQYFSGGVFWINFVNTASIPSEVAACGRAGFLDLRLDFHLLSLEDQVQVVRSAWQSELPRLLIFDNCDNETLLGQWRPRIGQCRVLLTSVTTHWSKASALSVHMNELDRPDSIALLHEFRPDISRDDTILNAIAYELGDLPLALHLAGSFLELYQNTVTPQDYLEQLQNSDLLLHPSLQGYGQSSSLSPTLHEQHVARTFELHYNKLNGENMIDNIALRLLARAAYLSPGSLFPADFLIRSLEIENNSALTDLLKVEDALRRLTQIGMLDSLPDHRMFRIHRLICIFVRSRNIDPEAQFSLERTASQFIAFLDPREHSSLNVHLHTIIDLAMGRQDTQAANLSNNFGDYLRAIGDYSGARTCYEQALVAQEHSLDPADPEIAETLNKLALVLEDEGKYAEVIGLCKRALSIRQKSQGAEHPATAYSINLLAMAFARQGQYADALRYYQQALAIREKVLGPDDLDTAYSLNGLAMALHDLGDYKLARPLLERALRIRTKQLGNDSLLTAISFNTLGIVLFKQGDYEGAAASYANALATRNKILGEDHPTSARTKVNLAELLIKQGDYDTARLYITSALAAQERMLDLEHPDIANSLHFLGMVNQYQGDTSNARSFYERALAIRERTLGPNHPDLAFSLNGLAILLTKLGELDRAEQLLSRALFIRKSRLGRKHPLTANIYIAFAWLAEAKHNQKLAIRLFRHASSIQQKVLGIHHPVTALTENALSEAHAKLKNNSKV